MIPRVWRFSAKIPFRRHYSLRDVNKSAHIRPSGSNISALSSPALSALSVINQDYRLEMTQPRERSGTVPFRRSGTFVGSGWTTDTADLRSIGIYVTRSPSLGQKVTDTYMRETPSPVRSCHACGKRVAVRYWLSRSAPSRVAADPGFSVPLEFDGSRSGKCRSDQVVEASGTYADTLRATIYRDFGTNGSEFRPGSNR